MIREYDLEGYLRAKKALQRVEEKLYMLMSSVLSPGICQYSALPKDGSPESCLRMESILEQKKYIERDIDGKKKEMLMKQRHVISIANILGGKEGRYIFFRHIRGMSIGDTAKKMNISVRTAYRIKRRIERTSIKILPSERKAQP